MPDDPLTAILWALATFRLARLVAVDTFPPVAAIRSWFLDRWPADDTEFDVQEAQVVDKKFVHHRSGRELIMISDDTLLAAEPHWAGELVSCVWCCSFWIALLVTGVGWFLPDLVTLASWPLALSAVAGLLHGPTPSGE